MKEEKSKTIRVNKDLYEQALSLSKSMRPKTTLTYLMEDALTDYLNKTSEKEENYRTRTKKQ